MKLSPPKSIPTMSDEPREPMTDERWETELQNVISALGVSLATSVVRLRADRESLLKRIDSLRGQLEDVVAASNYYSEELDRERRTNRPTGVDRG